MKRLAIVFVLSLTCLISSLKAESNAPNKYELAIIEDNIRTSFNTLMQIWKEELYFEMYDFGQKQTRVTLQKGEFVQRMVDLKWKPAIKEEKLKKVHIIYRNFAAVHAVILFQNKTNPTYTIEKIVIFPVILEKNGWKYDLTQIIRSPYIGKIPKKETQKPATAKAVKEPKDENEAQPTPVDE